MSFAATSAPGRDAMTPFSRRISSTSSCSGRVRRVGNWGVGGGAGASVRGSRAREMWEGWGRTRRRREPAGVTSLSTSLRLCIIFSYVSRGGLAGSGLGEKRKLAGGGAGGRGGGGVKTSARTRSATSGRRARPWRCRPCAMGAGQQSGRMSWKMKGEPGASVCPSCCWSAAREVDWDSLKDVVRLTKKSDTRGKEPDDAPSSAFATSSWAR